MEPGQRATRAGPLQRSLRWASWGHWPIQACPLSTAPRPLGLALEGQSLRHLWASGALCLPGCATSCPASGSGPSAGPLPGRLCPEAGVQAWPARERARARPVAGAGRADPSSWPSAGRRPPTQTSVWRSMMSWPTSGMVAPAFSHSTLRSSRGDGGSGSSSFFTQAGVPWAFRRLSQGRLLGVCCFSGCGASGRGAGERQGAAGGRRGGRPGQEGLQGGAPAHLTLRLAGPGAGREGGWEPACPHPDHTRVPCQAHLRPAPRGPAWAHQAGPQERQNE